MNPKMDPEKKLPGLHESPNLFLVCAACGHATRGQRYCDRCTEEIDALNAAARRKSVQTGTPADLVASLPLPSSEQCRIHLLAIGLVLLVYLMSLSLHSFFR